LALAGRALADPTSPSGLAPPEDVACEPYCGDEETNADANDADADRATADQTGAAHVDRLVVRELLEPEDVDRGDTSIDGENARSALDAGASFVEDSLAATSGLVDTTSLHDLAARHQRPSRWGRVDLAITWRRIDSYDEPSEPSRRHELLLVATWRN
jgi:hypothetical protein